MASPMRNELGGLVHDIVTLAELQSKLLAEDTRTVAQSARNWAVILTAACLLALASLPAIVLGVAYLVTWTGLSLATSMLLVSGMLLVITLVIAMVSLGQLKRATSPLQRSWHELQRNLDWIKRRLAR